MAPDTDALTGVRRKRLSLIGPKGIEGIKGTKGNRRARSANRGAIRSASDQALVPPAPCPDEAGHCFYAKATSSCALV